MSGMTEVVRLALEHCGMPAAVLQGGSSLQATVSVQSADPEGKSKEQLDLGVLSGRDVWIYLVISEGGICSGDVVVTGGVRYRIRSVVPYRWGDTVVYWRAAAFSMEVGS